MNKHGVNENDLIPLDTDALIDGSVVSSDDGFILPIKDTYEIPSEKRMSENYYIDDRPVQKNLFYNPNWYALAFFAFLFGLIVSGCVVVFFFS